MLRRFMLTVHLARYCIYMVRTYQKTKQKITLHKGDDALATRRTVAKALNPSLIGPGSEIPPTTWAPARFGTGTCGFRATWTASQR